jgi:lipoyl synthase
MMGQAEAVKVQESPEYLQLSLAADMTLGFRGGRFWRNARMTCINLLLTYKDGCKANCSYCGLARDRQAEERTFIHVPWPTRSLDEIIEKLNGDSPARRTCISMITHRRAKEDTLAIVRRLCSETSQPVSILLTPSITNKDYLEQLKAAGVDKIGIAIDAATEELFEQNRGREVRGPHRWKTYWKRFEEAVEVFGQGEVGSHLIYGLGEREEDLVRCFQGVHDLGGVNHLFSFFPEQGSALEGKLPAPIDGYRRVQLACHLIDEGQMGFDDFEFDPASGKITRFNISQKRLEEAIDEGEAFRTRGCKGCDGEVDCNRPFGNSWPGKGLRNYPFKPEKEDIRLIRLQLEGQWKEEDMGKQEKSNTQKKILFAIPNMKHYEIDSCSNRGGKNFLAVSVTGRSCGLLCDHCQGKLLQTMPPTQTPEDLWNFALKVSRQGAKGLLISGGCNKKGEVPLKKFAGSMARIRKELGFKLAVHSKFVSEPLADALAQAEVDSVMIDLPGSEKIIKDVFHLPQMGFESVKNSLDVLEERNLPVSPHLLVGFGNEMDRTEETRKAISLIQGRKLQSLVVVFLMPLPGTPLPKPTPMPLEQVGDLFRHIRKTVSDAPVYLGCARPPGPYQVKLEVQALKHGFDGIAFPTEETVQLVKKRQYEIEFNQCCCALLGIIS